MRFSRIGWRTILVACVLLSCPGWGQVTIFQQPLSPRIANYHIRVTLDAKDRILVGREMILWHNKTNETAQDLRFHLYLNGFRNNRSTFMKESGGSHRDFQMDKSGWGFSDIDRLAVLVVPEGENPAKIGIEADHPAAQSMRDHTATLGFLHPDDGNLDDKTYFRVPLEEGGVPPGGSAWIAIDFTAQLPEPPFARTGAKAEYFFVGQWFPKIAVFQNGKWTDHQFHYNTEFFADFGTYDVFMTVPSANVLGATGLRIGQPTVNGDATSTHYYHAEDVHDFAWTTSPDFVEGTLRTRGVTIRALVQKDHAALLDRHLESARIAIEYCDDWYGPYPFPNLTIVDPRRGAGGSGGMEYPTLITAGTRYRQPAGDHSLEVVIIHEFAHNYWYHLLASNEFEESWLDEGITSYTELSILRDKFGFANLMDMYSMAIDSLDENRAFYLLADRFDPTVRPGWKYYSRLSYAVNSYPKPALFLATLENYLGTDVMHRIMQTYVREFSFKHPVSTDFIAVANRVSGRDLNWFFEQALYTRNVVDYAVDGLTSEEIKADRGYDFDMETSTPGVVRESRPSRFKTYRSEVKVLRKGDFVFPVEIEFRFENGASHRENWDGRDLWKIYEFKEPHRLVSAIVDPDYKIPLDIDFTNNSRTLEAQWAPPAKQSLNWLGRVQLLLDLVGL